MSLPDQLRDLLACPKTHEPLEYLPERELLYARKSWRAYRVEDGLPILLVEEGREVDAAEAAELEALLEAAT